MATVGKTGETSSMNQPATIPSQQILLTAREAARLLAVSERTLWTLTNSGQIRRLKIGAAVRYRFTDLQAYVDGLAIGSENRGQPQQASIGLTN